MKQHNLLHIFDFSVNPYLQVTIKDWMATDDYFMVFSPWQPVLNHPKRRSLQSEFASWYPIRKSLFEGPRRQIICNRDYMLEKLSTASPSDQKESLDQIHHTLEHGNAGVGRVIKFVTERKYRRFYEGKFPEIGRILFTDRAPHPRFRGRSINKRYAIGGGAYPWCPWEDRQSLIDAY